MSSHAHGFHTYHLVDIRPWPLTSSIRAIMLTTGLVKWFHQFNKIKCVYVKNHLKRVGSSCPWPGQWIRNCSYDI